RRIRLRHSPLGPIVSDTAFFRAPHPLALAWVGARASDELGAMLRLARAGDIEEARRALEGFAVPGQTMLVATADGAVGAIRAAHLPRRPAAPADLARAPDEAWPGEPFAVLAREPPRDGAEGIVVSANDRAAPCPFPIGYFFSPPDRAARLRALLGGGEHLAVADLVRAQLDMVHPAALALRDALLAHAGTAALAGPAREALCTLAAWDGSYPADSAGALVFEAVVAELSRALPGPRRLAPLAGLWTARGLIGEEILATPPALLAPALARALGRAARLRRRWRNWGGVHRLRLSHPAGGVPLIGRRYRFGSFPVGGGNDTPNKTGHGPVRGRHAVTFGTSARHVSDLADPDENHFVLLGGQDGWLGSANFADQVPLWRAGETIRVPLTAAAVARQFPFETVLTPP
ncbi:MAG: penicillin acylase family protein, partial [Acetobacteraceae bacterium]